MGGEGLHRPVDHRLSADRTVLFRSASAGTKATACGNEYGGSSRLVWHRLWLSIDRN
jgi:hypothetical protein